MDLVPIFLEGRGAVRQEPEGKRGESVSFAQLFIDKVQRQTGIANPYASSLGKSEMLLSGKTLPLIKEVVGLPMLISFSPGGLHAVDGSPIRYITLVPILPNLLPWTTRCLPTRVSRTHRPAKARTRSLLQQGSMLSKTRSHAGL